MSHHLKEYITISETADKLARTVADKIVNLIDSTLRSNALCTILLSGGSTPEKIYHLLASAPCSSIAWNRVHLFWGDERCVPANHPDSNQYMIRKTLLNQISIPEDNIHPIPTTDADPQECARQYSHVLKEFFVQNEHPPCFDLVLLGLGTDGHTASLFPGMIPPEHPSSWTIAIPQSPMKPFSPRISVTFPVINKGKTVFVLVAGSSKKNVLSHLLQRYDSSRYPIASLRLREQVQWFADRDAVD